MNTLDLFEDMAVSKRGDYYMSRAEIDAEVDKLRELVAAVQAERVAREAAHVGSKVYLMGDWKKARERVKAALLDMGEKA